MNIEVGFWTTLVIVAALVCLAWEHLTTVPPKHLRTVTGVLLLVWAAIVLFAW